MMRSVKAIYDGQTLKLLEEIEVTTPQEVIVVFLQEERTTEEDIQASEIQELIQHSPAFDFLHKEEEDVYTDADLKVRYQ